MFFFEIFRNVFFRSFFSFLFSLLAGFLLYPKLIFFLKNVSSVEQPIRNFLNWHEIKSGTPTMGGVLIILITTLSSIFFSDLRNNFVLILLFALISFGLIGFFDDLKKIKKKNHIGLSAKKRILLEIFFTILITFAIIQNVKSDFAFKIYIPILGFITIGFFYFIFSFFVITGSANAVNLTDGLDGLASFPVIFVFIFFYIITIIYNLNTTLLNLNGFQNFFINGEILEITTIFSSLIGALISFLWNNVKPAKIFMGDVGALSLGAVIGTSAIMLKKEFLILIVGSIFVVETISVIIQVLYFKKTKGKRFFLMAPLHHHFEKKGESESRIVFKFWIFGILSFFLGILLLFL